MFIVISLHVCLEINLSAICVQFLKKKQQQQKLPNCKSIDAISQNCEATAGDITLRKDICSKSQDPPLHIPEITADEITAQTGAFTIENDCFMPSQCIPISESSDSIHSMSTSQSTASLSTVRSSSSAESLFQTLRIEVQRCKGLDLVEGEVPLCYLRCTSLCRCGTFNCNMARRRSCSANTAINAKVVMDNKQSLQLVWKSCPIEIDLSKCCIKCCSVRFELMHRRRWREGGRGGRSGCANPFASLHILFKGDQSLSPKPSSRRQSTTTCISGDTILASCTNSVSELFNDMASNSNSCVLYMKSSEEPTKHFQLGLNITPVGMGPFDC